MAKKPTISNRTGTRAKQRAAAESYLWHLTLDGYSHDHWWGTQPERVPRIAALWEVFRRHPATGQALKRLPAEFRDPARRGFNVALLKRGVRDALAAWCRQPWNALGQFQRMTWRRFLDDEGVNGRGYRPPARVLWRPGWTPLDGLAVPTLTAERAAGRVVISFDPFAPDVGAEIERIAAECRNGKPARAKGHAHTASWLTVIAEFETQERQRDQCQVRDDQLAARYRRVMDAVES